MTAAARSELPIQLREARAFLGYHCRLPVVRYSFDGRHLVCWESWNSRVGKIIAGAVIGPGLTAAWLAGLINPLPWYILLLVGAINALAWVGWIDALRNSYQVAADAVSRELQFFLNPSRPPFYVLSFDRICGFEIETIKRSKSMKPPTPEMIERYRVRIWDHHNVVAILNDDRRIYVLESTDRAIPEAVKSALDEMLAIGRR